MRTREQIEARLVKLRQITSISDELTIVTAHVIQALEWVLTPEAETTDNGPQSLQEGNRAQRDFLAKAVARACAEICEEEEVLLPIAAWHGTKKAMSAATARGLGEIIRARFGLPQLEKTDEPR